MIGGNPFLQGGPYVMGILNVTPDSFSDGGRFFDPEHAIARGIQMVAEGADIIDIGGESTRPGAVPVSPVEEIGRVVPVIAGLKDCGAILSIDTRHAATMCAALDAGASMINDVSALTGDPESLSVVRDSSVPVCLMHMQGNPVDMQDNPNYSNVIKSIYLFLEEKIQKYETFGICKNRFIVDPGIGFGKKSDHNLSLIRNIKKLHALGVPILIGLSRKSFIAQIIEKDDWAPKGGRVDNCPPGDRLPGSLAALLHALDEGVQIFRVHDIKETRQAIAVWKAIKSAD